MPVACYDLLRGLCRDNWRNDLNGDLWGPKMMLELISLHKDCEAGRNTLLAYYPKYPLLCEICAVAICDRGVFGRSYLDPNGECRKAGRSERVETTRSFIPFGGREHSSDPVRDGHGKSGLSMREDCDRRRVLRKSRFGRGELLTVCEHEGTVCGEQVLCKHYGAVFDGIACVGERDDWLLLLLGGGLPVYRERVRAVEGSEDW